MFQKYVNQELRKVIIMFQLCLNLAIVFDQKHNKYKLTEITQINTEISACEDMVKNKILFA